MASVDQMRDWLAKMYSSENKSETSGMPVRPSNRPNMVLTPKNIPQFTIPRSLESLSSTSSDGSSEAESSYPLLTSSDGSLSTQGSTPNRSVSPYGSLYPPSTNQRSRSAPVSPQRAPGYDLEEEKSSTYATQEFLRTKTCYGFETLAERPHTRRKESIYHSETSISRGVRRSLLTSSSKHASMPLVCDGAESANAQAHKAEENGGKTNEASSQTNFAAGSHMSRRSSFPCPISQTSPSVTGSYKDLSQIKTDKRKTEAVRSNVSSSKKGTLIRRATCLDYPGMTELVSKATAPNELRITSKHPTSCVSATPTLPYPLFSSFKRDPEGCGSPNHGEINVSCQYLPESSRLKVVIHKAKNLGGTSRDSTGVNPYIKLCLMPGKIQKQHTKAMKANANPSYSAEFFFSNITLKQVRSMQLRVKAVHKGNSLKKTAVLGEQQLELGQISDLLLANNVWLKLLKKVPYELGRITVSCCFEPKKSRLDVTLVRATDLPRNLTSMPDPYVRLLLSQPRRLDVKRQSRIKTTTSNPCFDEKFVFDISTKVEDLRYTTLTLTAFDRDRLRSDGIIGQVQLGPVIFDECEQENDFWRCVLQNPGFWYEASFSLRDVDNK